MTVAYADASALAKLAKSEPESAALQRAIDGVSTLLTSVIGRIEFERAIRRDGVDGVDALIEEVLDGVEVIPMNVAIAAIAATTSPPTLRSFDAIHLATIRALRDDLDVVFCYDERLATAAAEYGISVSAPR